MTAALVVDQVDLNVEIEFVNRWAFPPLEPAQISRELADILIAHVHAILRTVRPMPSERDAVLAVEAAVDADSWCRGVLEETGGSLLHLVLGYCFDAAVPEWSVGGVT